MIKKKLLKSLLLFLCCYLSITTCKAQEIGKWLYKINQSSNSDTINLYSSHFSEYYAKKKSARNQLKYEITKLKTIKRDEITKSKLTFKIASLYYKLNEYDSAQIYLNKIKNINQLDIEEANHYHFYQGHINKHKRNYEKSLYSFEKIEANKKDDSLFSITKNNIIWLKHKLKNENILISPSEIEGSYEDYLKLKKGNDLIINKRYLEAIQYFDNIESKFKNDSLKVYIHIYKGISKYLSGQTIDAHEDLQKAMVESKKTVNLNACIATSKALIKIAEALENVDLVQKYNYNLNFCTETIDEKNDQLKLERTKQFLNYEKIEQEELSKYLEIENTKSQLITSKLREEQAKNDLIVAEKEKQITIQRNENVELEKQRALQQIELLKSKEKENRAQILRELAEKESEIHKVKDGMDMGICFIPRKKDTEVPFTIIFSGARRPIHIYNNRDGICTIEGIRKGIGGKQSSKIEFENQTIVLNKTDRLYLYTDGLTDQMNIDSKKIGKRNIINWIENTSALTLEDQCNQIDLNLKSHQGDERQLDDILFFGFEV